MDWKEICPICMAQKEGLIFCCKCEYQLKPAGGIDNDPESICIKEKKEVLNFVTGKPEIISILCKDKNINGKCINYENNKENKTNG